jgi:hypothetical protein
LPGRSLSPVSHTFCSGHPHSSSAEELLDLSSVFVDLLFIRSYKKIPVIFFYAIQEIYRRFTLVMLETLHMVIYTLMPPLQ